MSGLDLRARMHNAVAARARRERDTLTVTAGVDECAKVAEQHYRRTVVAATRLMADLVDKADAGTVAAQILELEQALDELKPPATSLRVIKGGA